MSIKLGKTTIWFCKNLFSCINYLLSALTRNFWGGAGFSTSVARRKTIVQLGSLGGAVSPPQWGPGTTPQKIFGYFAFWISSKHHLCGSAKTNSDQSLPQKSTLLRVWGSEFEIPNQYNGFKIALDTALLLLLI